MFKSQWGRFSIALLASTFAACGGSGGGGSSSAPVATTPPPTTTPTGPTVIAANLVTSVPAFTGSTDHIAAYTRINAVRGACGFGLLSQNSKLETAAQNHSNYMGNNFAAHNDVYSHLENAAYMNGFTGVNPSDRTALVGYGSLAIGEDRDDVQRLDRRHEQWRCIHTDIFVRNELTMLWLIITAIVIGLIVLLVQAANRAEARAKQWIADLNCREGLAFDAELKLSDNAVSLYFDRTHRKLLLVRDKTEKIFDFSYITEWNAEYDMRNDGKSTNHRIAISVVDVDRPRLLIRMSSLPQTRDWVARLGAIRNHP